MVSLTEEGKVTLDNLLAQAIAENRVPGAYFAAATPDAKLYSGSAGVKSFKDPTSGKVDKNSVFWICSMTKLVVTVAIIQLIETGVITLETPVESIVPELANPVVVDDVNALEYTYKPAQNKMLIKHLLNHSSGLHYAPDHRKASVESLSPAYTAVAYGGDNSWEKFFELIRYGLPTVPLAFEPGTSWAYGWSCDIIALIVERVTSKSIAEYCNEKIFGPIGMKSTSFYLTPELEENLVNLAYRRKDGVLEVWNGQLGIIERDPSKVGILLGGIGIYTKLDDYLLFLRHLLLAQTGKATNPILSVASISSLFRPSLPENCSENIEAMTGWKDCQFGYGLCLANTDWPGRRKKGSGFWYGWAGTYYFMDPTTGIAVVYGTQVVPPTDPEVDRLWAQLETALYAGLKE
ncbi:beta-lactamase/transpeptidase-like protein [Pholiota conissans]|uniref:Beta-lactamase/transpeptidase-like protein n=1 Tax=Pholiota conissans TaxID=109636 RepID=A0A9P6CXJ9_9AGAR|nr:beta-lactamase/transpeptidase-like protein [Pholiota conissans]